MNENQYNTLLKKIDHLQASVAGMEKELAQLKGQTLPTLFWQTSQQTEYLDLLLRKLDRPRGWLPPTRGWAASPDFLLLVADHILAAKPQTVVECGCGTSSVVFARCLQINGTGKLYSIEHDDRFRAKTAGMLQTRDLCAFTQLCHTPLTDLKLLDIDFKWYDLSRFPDIAIDCLIVDGPPSQLGAFSRYPAGPLLFNRLSPQTGVVFADDLFRDGIRRSFNQWKHEFRQLTASIEDTEKGCGVLRFARQSA